MPLVFSANPSSRATAVFRSTLAAPALAGDTSIVLETGDGALLPALGSGNTMVLLLGDDTAGIEVICTGRSGDLLTCEELESGPWAYGTLVSATITPYMLREFVQRSELSSVGAVSSVAGRTGDVTLSAGDISGLGTAASHAHSDYATAAQGALAETALQSAPVASVAGKAGAVTLEVADISGLGTAASHAHSDYATAAQGALADTAVQPSGLSGYATLAALSAEIAAIVGTSPNFLDTLAEIDAAIGNDPNFATTVATALASKQPLSDILTALAALTPAPDSIPYVTGDSTAALLSVNATIRGLLASASKAAFRTGLELGNAATKDVGTGTGQVAAGDHTHAAGSFLPAQTTTTLTTATLAAGASEVGTVSLAKSFMLVKATCATPCRVRLYATAAARTADSARALGVQLSTGAGLITELLFTALVTSVDFSPVAMGANLEGSRSASIAYSVTNTGAADATPSITFTYLGLE